MDQELALRQSQSLTLQARSDLTSTGKCSLDLAGHPLTNEDFTQLVDTLKILFPDRDSQSGLSEADANRAALLFAKLLERGWSQERFELTIDGFQCHKFFGKQWSLGDFFEYAPENDLHNHAWVDSEREKNPEAMRRMEGFRLNGEGPSMWRYVSNVQLPPEYVKVYPPSEKNWKPGRQR